MFVCVCVSLSLFFRAVAVAVAGCGGEEGEEGGDEPNHVTTDILRSVPQDC